MKNSFIYKAISIYADVILSILIYVYVVEITLNLLALFMNSELALLLGWVIVPIMMLIAYIASIALVTFVLFFTYDNWKREVTPKDKMSITNKFLLSFLYLIMIILLYFFLSLNKKPCSDCLEFQSFVNEFIINK